MSSFHDFFGSSFCKNRRLYGKNIYKLQENKKATGEKVFNFKLKVRLVSFEPFGMQHRQPVNYKPKSKFQNKFNIVHLTP